MTHSDDRHTTPDEARIDPQQALDEAEEHVLGRPTSESYDDTDSADPVDGDSGTGVDEEPAD